MTESTPQPVAIRGARALLRLVLYVLLGVVILIVGLWTFGALYYSNLPWPLGRTILAWGFVLATVGALLFLKNRRRTVLWFFATFLAVGFWFWTVSPSNDRDWQPDVARLARATIDGDKVTIHDVRDFQYRSNEDFTPRWIDHTVDLSKLATVDFLLSYWDGNRDIAHTLVTFGFETGEYLTLSVETRKVLGQTYSTTAGFFKQYGLIYILAEERDVVGVRTNYRNEDIYLYPMNYTREQARKAFLNVITTINEIYDHPRFYNALFHNCTTSLIPLADGVRTGPFVFDWRLIMNGYIDQWGYEQGTIVKDTSEGLPYEEMRAKHRITEVARRVGDGPEFSKKVREALPPRTH